MKKLILTFTAALMLAAPLSIANPAAVHAADVKIGTIDVQRILSQSALLKALKQAEGDVQEAEKRLIEARNKKLEELQKLQQKVVNGEMKEEDFLNQKRKYEDEIRNQAKAEEKKLEGKKDQIRQQKEKLEKNVEETVQKIAKQKGLDIVINKQLVLFGGTDITEDVMKAMPKS